MNNLESSQSWSICLPVIPRVILFMVSLFAPALMAEVSAQTVSSRPVARLITSTSDEIGYLTHGRARAGNTRRPEAPSSVVFPSINHATEAERRAFAATNRMRARNGVPPLIWDSELCRMARAHSERMGRLGFLAHDMPGGMRLKDRAQAARIRFQVIGENIAYNQGVDDPGAFAVQRWMISSGHRANILSPEFRSSGIGSFVTEEGRVYLTQIFIAP